MNKIVSVAVVACLSGCASILDGSSQSLSVKTISGGNDLAGAQCTLVNNKGTWFLTTPGTVTVHRSYDPLSVTCQHEGFVPAQTASESSTKGMAWGNILAGGVIGGAVDMGTGAAYDYPSPLIVPMQPTQSAQNGPSSAH